MNDRNNKTVLEVTELTKHFRKPSGRLFSGDDRFAAVDHVSFSMYEGEMLGLLGESGCGKSTLARMLMHLTVPSSGRILLDGTEIQRLPEHTFRKLRHRIQMVFQNPFDCLDPSRKICSLLEEPLKRWQPDLDRDGRRERIREMLMECALPDNCLEKHPAEFSGGQLQRISIARALLAKPQVLVADEIVSALDVSIQSQILQLLEKMKEEHHLSVLFITHDLSVARKVSDRIMVMKNGKIIGTGKPEEIFAGTQDPYIQALAAAAFSFTGGTGDGSPVRSRQKT